MKHESLKAVMAELEVDPSSSTPAEVQKALGLARVLQKRGVGLQTPEEKRQQRELERMMGSESDKITLTQMTDQAFRATAPRRAAEQLTHILDVQGVPRFFSTFDRTLLKGFQSFGNYLPGVAMPMVREKMREETANVILPAEHEVLKKHLEERRQGGVRMNVNYLGEALLGEEDAQNRLKSYLAALQLPEIEVISVKATTIYSQITPISRRHAVKVLCDRLELLYRAAARERYVRADGTEVPKFVYIDMEEYRDLGVTLEAFMKTLDRPGLASARAGLALQAYIPDSFEAQQTLNAWARERVKKGGAPVTIRLVKGANMEMERVEASIAGWEQAPYKEKLDTDANYKRMLHEALRPENIEAVNLGIASHNLFEVAYALVLVHERKLLDKVQFEMLEGMANHQRRALSEVAPNILLYAPATRQEEFINAIGYLIRRLDENSGPDNFLRHAFKLEVDSEEWQQLEEMFLKSFERLERLATGGRRTQDRNAELPEEPAGEPIALEDFVNEPDTDFSAEHNLRWAEGIAEAWKGQCDENATPIGLSIAGELIALAAAGDRRIAECHDPSRPGTVVGRYP
ncbi:MAG: proline dehydrogenase family protein, partial [Polyangiaceae bacterium]